MKRRFRGRRPTARRSDTRAVEASVPASTPAGAGGAHAHPGAGAPTASDGVPAGVTVGARYTGRMLVIGAGLAAVGVLAVVLSEVVIPFLIGLVLAALMVPMSASLHRHHWPKAAAIGFTWVVVFAVIAGLVLLVITGVQAQLPALEHHVNRMIDQFRQLLATHPFGLTEQKLTGYLDAVIAWLQAHAAGIGTGALRAGSAFVHALEGVFIVVFTTLFAMIDGPRIWTWVVHVFPRAAHARIDAAGQAGWHTLSAFIRIQLVVAASDAVGIGIGAAILGVPLAVPIAVVVFFGALIPVVGAIVTGILAVGLALLFNGWVQALIMLGIVLLVQQIEGHVLHPLLTGSAVRVHPLGVVLGVITGTVVAGIAGAFFAVPAIATANSMIHAAHDMPPDSPVPRDSGQTSARPSEDAPR